ncbi:MAG TPA: hypothetical protein VH024_14075, partial [Candidatus Angelobacter sp.]|nr:hypothetical protein [Candidatus Angelobacter sp.]
TETSTLASQFQKLLELSFTQSSHNNELERISDDVVGHHPGCTWRKAQILPHRAHLSFLQGSVSFWHEFDLH